MAGAPQAPVTWVNPLPVSVTQDQEIILNSLTTWLQNPTFTLGLTANGPVTLNGNAGIGVSGGTANTYQLKGGQSTVTTDASGVFTVTYSTAFPTATDFLVACVASTAIGGSTFVQINATTSATSFTGRFVNGATGNGVTGSLPVNWIAIGH